MKFQINPFPGYPTLNMGPVEIELSDIAYIEEQEAGYAGCILILKDGSMVSVTEPPGIVEKLMANSGYQLESIRDKVRPDKHTILVWKFQDAPEPIKVIASSGGDEDWVAFVPKCLRDEYIHWLEVGCFGICHVKRYRFQDGDILVGKHA